MWAARSKSWDASDQSGLRRYVWIVPGCKHSLEDLSHRSAASLSRPYFSFAHFLIGGAHESTTSSTGALITASPTRNAFATTLGGGLDLKVLPFISLRPIQIDYLLTHFNSNTQNQFRYSAGIVLRF